MHDRIRDTVYALLRWLLPLAEVVYDTNDVSLEASHVLPDFPNLRPADVAVLLANHTHQKLLLDINVTHMPQVSLRDTKLTPPVVQHHEVNENKKYRRGESAPRATRILQSILAHQLLLLPCTVDPGG